MTTVTGKIENAAGSTLNAKINFKSASTPLAGAAGLITTNTSKTVRSDPATGQFAVALAAGNYTVTITAESLTTTFNIAVPDGSSSLSIDQLVSTPLAFVFTPPNTVWNGVRVGHITFIPIANPPAVNTQAVTYNGGHQGALDLFAYVICWVNANGDLTLASPDAVNTPPSGAHNATRVLLPSPPQGVTQTLIFRSTNDSTVKRYLLASVGANILFYDDWESTADFNARLNPAQVPPLFNYTSGELRSSNGTICAYISDQGLFIPALLFAQANAWLYGADNQAPNQTLVSDDSILTKKLGDALYTGANAQSGVTFRFSSAQFQMYDAVAAGGDLTHPWRALGMDSAQTVWSNPILDGGVNDNGYAPPAGANYRLADGQFQMWDAVAAAATPLTPWRALGCNAGQLFWSDPIADAGANLDLVFNPNANYRLVDGQFQIWDQAQILIDPSRPWRALGVNGGGSVLSNPISN